MSKLNLAPREKRLISVMFVVMVCIAVIPVYRNIVAQHKTSVQQLAQAKERLATARLMHELIVNEREGQRVIMQKMRARPAGFDLFNFCSSTAKRFKIDGRADFQQKNMSSDEGAFEGVQISLRNVGMKEIVDFTHALYESNNLITMQRMSRLSPSRDGKGLDCELVFITPKR